MVCCPIVLLQHRAFLSEGPETERPRADAWPNVLIYCSRVRGPGDSAAIRSRSHSGAIVEDDYGY